MDMDMQQNQMANKARDTLSYILHGVRAATKKNLKDRSAQILNFQNEFNKNSQSF